MSTAPVLPPALTFAPVGEMLTPDQSNWTRLQPDTNATVVGSATSVVQTQFTIPAGGGFLQTSTLYFRCLVTNTSVTNVPAACDAQVMAFNLINRVQIRTASKMLEDIRNFNELKELARCQQHPSFNAYPATVTEWTDNSVGTTASLLAAGATREATISFSPSVLLSRSGKDVPMSLSSEPLIILISWESPVVALTLAAGTSTAGFTVSGMQLCYRSIVMPELFVANMRSELARVDEGGRAGLKISGSAFQTYLTPVQASTPSQNILIPARARIKTLLHKHVSAALQVVNAYSIQNARRNGLSQWLYRYGATQVPTEALTISDVAYADAFVQVTRALGREQNTLTPVSFGAARYGGAGQDLDNAAVYWGLDVQTVSTTGHFGNNTWDTRSEALSLSMVCTWGGPGAMNAATVLTFVESEVDFYLSADGKWSVEV